MNKSYPVFCIKLCILLSLLLCFTSCAKAGGASAASTSAINLKLFTSTIEFSAGTLPVMDSYSTKDDDAEDWFHYLCDFDYSKVDDYYISYSSAGTAEEIFLIKLKNSQDSTAAELSLHNRVKSRIATFDQYQPEEVSKLRNAIITSHGNYVALLICQDEYSAKKAFQDAFSTM